MCPKSILVLHYATYVVVVGNIFPGKVRNKFNTMKKKMTNLLNQDKGAELFLDINELEFPGANTTLKKIHEVMWHEYYDCLKKQYIEAGEKKSLHPFALTAMEGTSATLRCTICISPNEMHTIESVDWFYSSGRDAQSLNSLVETNEHIIISPDDRSLILFNVKKNQEGIYWCKLESTLSAPYYLFVANDTEPIVIVRPDEAQNAQHSVPPIIVKELGILVYSSWTSWSPCSTCNAVGKRVRYGYCSVSLIHTVDMSSELNQLQLDLKKLLNNVLSIFQNKLPCRSWYTPRDIQEIPEVKNRTSEVMKSFCKVRCRRNVIFEIRDIKGNVLESANNSAGIYSLLQGMPDPQPSIVRVTLYGIHGTSEKIKCPGNLNTDLPIVWQLGTRILNPRTIEQQSHGRIFIDAYQQIIFKELRYADENIYSCWQRSQLAGTVRLKVTYELTSEIVKLDHRVLMFVSIPIVSMMLWVYWRAFQGRNRYTKR